MKNRVITPKVRTPEFIKELMNMIKEDVITPISSSMAQNQHE